MLILPQGIKGHDIPQGAAVEKSGPWTQGKCRDVIAKHEAPKSVPPGRPLILKINHNLVDVHVGSLRVGVQELLSIIKIHDIIHTH